MNSNDLYLVQTDTTAGFVSTDTKKLSKVKNRDINQPFLVCVSSNKKLQILTRIPKNHKNLIRRSSKKSFLYKNKKAIRVVKDSQHSKFLDKFDYLLSTSANQSGLGFDLNYALSCVNIIVEDNRSFFEMAGSKIYKLGNKKIHKLR